MSTLSHLIVQPEPTSPTLKNRHWYFIKNSPKKEQSTVKLEL